MVWPKDVWKGREPCRPIETAPSERKRRPEWAIDANGRTSQTLRLNTHSPSARDTAAFTRRFRNSETKIRECFLSVSAPQNHS